MSSREPHTPKSVTTAHQHRRQGDHDRETENQQQRVDHPLEAGRRIQERKGKQKANNKESVTPASQKGDQGTHGKTESQQQTVPQQNSPSTQHICT